MTLIFQTIVIVLAIIIFYLLLKIAYAILSKKGKESEKAFNQIFDTPAIAIHRKYFGTKRYVKAPPIHNQYKHKDLI